MPQPKRVLSEEAQVLDIFVTVTAAPLTRMLGAARRACLGVGHDRGLPAADP
jgi:hypothetical protein